MLWWKDSGNEVTPARCSKCDHEKGNPVQEEGHVDIDHEEVHSREQIRLHPQVDEVQHQPCLEEGEDIQTAVPFAPEDGPLLPKHIQAKDGSQEPNAGVSVHKEHGIPLRSSSNVVLQSQD